MKHTLLRILCAGCCSLLVFVSGARADVKLPTIFSSHMVLQRGQVVPIWGDAKPGEKVTVKFRDQVKPVVADIKGKWLVKLDPLTVGAPTTLTVEAANTITLADVVVGEVWVGSGQSNMDLKTDYFTKGDPVLAVMVGESYPQIRLASVNQAWQVATPESIKHFSALLFAFGVPLQKELNVPVGLLQGAVGGTPSGYWLTKEMIADDPGCQTAIAQYETVSPFAQRQQKYEQSLAKYKVDLAGWEAEVAAAKAQSTQSVTTARVAAVTNGPAAVPALKLPPKPAAPVAPVHAGETPAQPVGCYYANYIEPLQPYAIRGVLWDQGESNTALLGLDQYTTMGALISGWRRAWGEGAFPFIYVQKPSGFGCAWDETNTMTKNADRFEALPPGVPDNPGDVAMFLKIMRYPNTGMAISSDLGSGLHPVNKSGYGQRAATVALGMVYGKKIEYYGPVYDSHKIEGNKVLVHFTHVGQGLAFKHGDKLQGFALAGADKKWYWADAVIDVDRVVLSSAMVSQPTAVRYGWSYYRHWANLFNQEGLPAIPFNVSP